MQPPRVSVFTGLSSCLVQSLLILLLLAGSLSAVSEPTSTDQPVTDNAVSVSNVFSETDAVPFTKSKNDSESFDMRHSSVDIAEAAVDPVDTDTSIQSSSTANNTLTEHTTLGVSTASSASTIVASTAASIDTSFTPSNATEPSSPLASTSAPIPMTTTTATTMPITNETVTESTIPTTQSQTDPAESTTAKALAEDSEGMPTGIVALVTMITFAMIVVVGYVSLIVWRRYLEYRYGNRELLVNDLEFDTNDLRHFEIYAKHVSETKDQLLRKKLKSSVVGRNTCWDQLDVGKQSASKVIPTTEPIRHTSSDHPQNHTTVVQNINQKML